MTDQQTSDHVSYRKKHNTQWLQRRQSRGFARPNLSPVQIASLSSSPSAQHKSKKEAVLNQQDELDSSPRRSVTSTQPELSGLGSDTDEDEEINDSELQQQQQYTTDHLNLAATHTDEFEYHERLLQELVNRRSERNARQHSFDNTFYDSSEQQKASSADEQILKRASVDSSKANDDLETKLPDALGLDEDDLSVVQRLKQIAQSFWNDIDEIIFESMDKHIDPQPWAMINALLARSYRVATTYPGASCQIDASIDRDVRRNGPDFLAFQNVLPYVIRMKDVPYPSLDVTASAAFFGPIVLLLLMILNFLGLFYLPVVFIAIAAVGIKERDNVCNYIEFPVQAYLLWKACLYLFLFFMRLGVHFSAARWKQLVSRETSKLKQSLHRERTIARQMRTILSFDSLLGGQNRLGSFWMRKICCDDTVGSFSQLPYDDLLKSRRQVDVVTYHGLLSLARYDEVTSSFNYRFLKVLEQTLCDYRIELWCFAPFLSPAIVAWDLLGMVVAVELTPQNCTSSRMRALI
eukprot:gene1176-4390_t